MVLAALAGGCSGGDAPREGPSGQSSAAIIDGRASAAQQNYVVAIVYPVTTGTALCSGSLVAPDLVLTARHCVSATADTGFSCDASGNGTDGGAIGADHDPASVLIYVGRDAPTALTRPSAHAVRFFHDDATNLCDHDLALVELSQPIAGAPLATLDLDSPLVAGQTITAIGWGVTRTGSPPGVRQQRTGIPVLAVGPATEPSGFDVAPGEFSVGESTCLGDSGGPALDAAGAVIGVVSSGGNRTTPTATDLASACVGPSAVNLYTEVAPFRGLILEAFAAVGAAPIRVGVPPPAAAGCRAARVPGETPVEWLAGCAALVTLGIGRRRGRRRAG